MDAIPQPEEQNKQVLKLSRLSERGSVQMSSCSPLPAKEKPQYVEPEVIEEQDVTPQATIPHQTSQDLDYSFPKDEPVPEDVLDVVSTPEPVTAECRSHSKKSKSECNIRTENSLDAMQICVLIHKKWLIKY